MVASSATAAVNCTLEELLDPEKETRCQWVLKAPDPPCMLQQVLGNIKDTLLPQRNKNRFSSLRNQPLSKRTLALLLNLFPFLGSLRGYNVHKFKFDLMAGLTLASLAIPQVQLYKYKIKRVH